MDAMDDLFSAERAAEYGHWRGLYLYDRLVDFQRARTLLRQSSAALAKAPVPPARASVYYTFYDYQLAVEPNYPYFFPSDQWNLWQFVHIACFPCDNATASGTLTLTRSTSSVAGRKRSFVGTLNPAPPVSHGPMPPPCHGLRPPRLRSRESH